MNDSKQFVWHYFGYGPLASRENQPQFTHNISTSKNPLTIEEELACPCNPDPMVWSWARRMINGEVKSVQAWVRKVKKDV